VLRALIFFLGVFPARGAGAVAASDFVEPEPVAILGYSGHAMEPFATRDGLFLLFNNLNQPSENTNLHWATRIDDRTFQYQGEIGGVNTAELEGVPSLDDAGTLYFVSTRSYAQTLSTIYSGAFAAGQATGIALVPGVSLGLPLMVNFDVEVSPDGETLYFVDSQFGASGPQTADLVVARRSGPGFERLPNSAVLLQSVNSAALEYAAGISRDGLTLFFTRAGVGPGGEPAIFLASRASAASPFGAPERIAAIDGFVEAASLSADERSLYYHRLSNGQFRIYRVHRAVIVPALEPPGAALLALLLGAFGSAWLLRRAAEPHAMRPDARSHGAMRHAQARPHGRHPVRLLAARRHSRDRESAHGQCCQPAARPTRQPQRPLVRRARGLTAGARRSSVVEEGSSVGVEWLSDVGTVPGFRSERWSLRSHAHAPYLEPPSNQSVLASASPRSTATFAALQRREDRGPEAHPCANQRTTAPTMPGPIA